VFTDVARGATSETIFLMVTDELREKLGLSGAEPPVSQLMDRVKHALTPRPRGRPQDNRERDLRLWALVQKGKSYKEAGHAVGLDSEWAGEGDMVNLVKKAVGRVDRWIEEVEQRQEQLRAP
jgi:hypothetical protein